MEFSKKTLGEQIADMLKARISKNEFKDGKLPKEEELAEDLQVSRGTVRSAMAILENENLIVRIKKKGTFIKGIVALIPESEKSKRLNLFYYSHIVNFYNINRSGFYGELFSAILSEASKRQYVLNVSIIDRGEQHHSSLKNCLDLVADGNILLALESKDITNKFLSKNKPCILVDHEFSDININVVNVENYNSTARAIKHLYDKGHRRFLFFNHHRVEANPERSNAVHDTLRELGIPRADISEYPLVPGVERGEIAMSSYLQNGGIRHTALIAFSADMAIGGMNALENAGYSVPEDMSVISCGNMGEDKNSKLSTLDYDLNLMGKMTVVRLLDMIEGKDTSIRKEYIRGELIDRGSIRAIK